MIEDIDGATIISLRRLFVRCGRTSQGEIRDVTYIMQEALTLSPVAEPQPFS